ncbi:MAG: hypothetical protein ACRD2B_08010 [Terriglobia bacterium]
MAFSHVVFWAALKLLVVVLALIYAGLVFAGYIIEGSHFQARINLSEPARSGERLLLWTGIKALDVMVRITRSLLDQLYIASAEVASWFVDMSSPTVQRKIRSRFI